MVTVTMVCGSSPSTAPAVFDFLVGGKTVASIYPGGFKRFYPDPVEKPRP